MPVRTTQSQTEHTAWQADSPLVLASPLAQNHDDVTMVMAVCSGSCATVARHFIVGSTLDYISVVGHTCLIGVTLNSDECHEVRFIAKRVRQQSVLVNACNTACYIPSRNFVTEHCEVKIIINGKTDI